MRLPTLGTRSFLVVTLVCACLAPVAAQRFAGRVLEVTDGDTVIVVTRSRARWC